MAINKELYERYKAMKAQKLAQQLENGNAVPSGFKALSSAVSSSNSIEQQTMQTQQELSQSSNFASNNLYSNTSSYQADEQTRLNYNINVLNGQL